VAGRHPSVLPLLSENQNRSGEKRMTQRCQQWQQWILHNLTDLSRIYGRNDVVLDAKTWRSILIVSYRLPTNWTPSRSRLLVVLPQGPQIFYSPPNRFYLDKGLRLISGRIPEHYFERGNYNDMSNRGMARFSFHLERGWHPRPEYYGGTTLKDVLRALNRGLSLAAEETMK
jgi:hypothetical protein